jgi:hypothetical protein
MPIRADAPTLELAIPQLLLSCSSVAPQLLLRAGPVPSLAVYSVVTSGPECGSRGQCGCFRPSSLVDMEKPTLWVFGVDQNRVLTK